MVINNMNITEQYTDRTPLDDLLEKEQAQIDYDDRVILIQFLTQTLKWIVEQDTNNHKAILLGVLYALMDTETMEESTRTRAKEIGVSAGLISHYTRLYQKAFNL